MADTSLRALLGRSRLDADDVLTHELQDTIETLVKNLSNPGINSQFRSDVLKVLTAAVELAKTVSSSVYSIDEVLENLALISANVSFLLSHVSRSRPRTAGYGLVHQDSGRILPSMFLQKPEADSYVNSMRSMGVLPPSVAIIPVEIVSCYVPRPREVQEAPIPQPAPEPLPRIAQAPTPRPQPAPAQAAPPAPAAQPQAIPAAIATAVTPQPQGAPTPPIPQATVTIAPTTPPPVQTPGT